MRVALLELDPGSKSATGVRAGALSRFLGERGHDVVTLSPRSPLYQHPSHQPRWLRLARLLSGRPRLPHLWDRAADALEAQVRRGGFDVLIGRGQAAGYCLTRGLPGLKILDMPNIEYLELYYASGPDAPDLETTCAREKALYDAVDHIVLHHDLLRDYFVEFVDPEGRWRHKLVSARMGCEPVQVCARFSDSPRIVYAGSTYSMQDPLLLAEVCRRSPLPVHCYGPRNPNRPYLPGTLRYEGFAPSVAFLADYQFGLVTVSRDRLREFSPSTKFPYYFAHGLPVLFPRWMREGHEYPGAAIGYEEQDIGEVITSACSRDQWERMSAAALAYSEKLRWTETLAPLGRILASHARTASPGTRHGG